MFQAAVGVIESMPREMHIAGWASTLIFPTPANLPKEIADDDRGREAYQLCFSRMLNLAFAWVKRETDDGLFLERDTLLIVPDYRNDVGSYLKAELAEALKFFGVAASQVQIVHNSKACDSERVLPLQAADLLTFETIQEVMRRLGGRKTPPRPWLKRLLLSRHDHLAHCREMKHVGAEVSPDAERRVKATNWISNLYESGLDIEDRRLWGIDDA